MERRKSALEEAQDAALNFALDDEDDVSVISFEYGEKGELMERDFSNYADSILPTSTHSMYPAYKRSSLTVSQSSPSMKAPKRNSCPSQPSNGEEDMEYQWARARALALASALQQQPGFESSDDDDLSIDSSKSEGSASKLGPQPPKRKGSFDSNSSKADEIFSQMQIQSGKMIVSRRSLPPSLTRKVSGESTATSKSAPTIKSFPQTAVKRNVSSQSSYQDPRHRKDYGRQTNRPSIRSTPPRPSTRLSRATSLGTSSVSSMSSSSFNANAAVAATANDEKEEERRVLSHVGQSFLRTMEDRLQMRIDTKERRHDEERGQRLQENQQQSLQENEDEEEDKPPSDTEILTAETEVVPTSVDLNMNETRSLAESSIQGRKTVHTVLIYCLLAIIAIATTAILVVVLTTQKEQAQEGPLVDEDDSPFAPPTIAPEVVPDEILAVVPKTICMEQVPGDGWSTQCNPEQSFLQGGGVCNLVAQSFLHLVEGADIAFQSSTACLGDVIMGNFTVADAYQILPHNDRLWIIEVTGFDILTVLEQVLEATFGINSGRRDYPYAAGLRFAVNASAPYPNRISDLEINRRLEQFAWEPLDMAGKYTIVASQTLLIAGSLVRQTPYVAFEQAYKDQFPKGKTWRQTTTTFIEYAEKEKVLRDPPLDTYSTTLFLP